LIVAKVPVLSSDERSSHLAASVPRKLNVMT
jgi:hypothetical protein